MGVSGGRHHHPPTHLVPPRFGREVDGCGHAVIWPVDGFLLLEWWPLGGGLVGERLVREGPHGQAVHVPLIFSRLEHRHLIHSPVRVVEHRLENTHMLVADGGGGGGGGYREAVCVREAVFVAQPRVFHLTKVLNISAEDSPSRTASLAPAPVPHSHSCSLILTPASHQCLTLLPLTPASHSLTHSTARRTLTFASPECHFGESSKSSR